MGKKSRDSFFDIFLKQCYPPRLTDHIQQIVETKKVPLVSIGDRKVFVLPIQHASGRNQKFSIIQHQQLAELIRRILEGKT